MNAKEDKQPRSKRKKRYAGFHFIGWNKQGVPKWEGLWEKGPPLWFCRMFVGITGLIVSLFFAFLFLLDGKDKNIALAVLAPESLLFGVITYLMYRQRSNMLPLKSAEEISAQLGIEEEALERLAENNKIKPRYIINDEPRYNPADFDEKGILLRASKAPVFAETLLRPATGQSEPKQNELLRPPANEVSYKTPTSETVSEPVAEVRNRRV